MDARLRRVNKEITGTSSPWNPKPTPAGVNTMTWHVPDCKNDKTSNVQIELIDNSPFHLKGSFQGPEGTPYEGGRFDVVSLIR